MTEKAVEKDNKTILKLEEKVTIYEVARLKNQLTASLKDTKLLEVDMSEVKDCDISGLQVLCCVKTAADLSSSQIILSGISATVLDVMNKSGITQKLISHNGGSGCQD